MSKKILGAGIVLMLVAAVFVGVGATTASAQSMSLCQTVDALVLAGVIAPDKVAAAKAAAGCSAVVTSSSCSSFTRNLTVGSTGADVTALQTKLGVSPATGYFGAITKAAVVAYQTANGIAPAAGYVGPITLAKLNYCAPVVVVPPVVVPPTVTPSTLVGTDGTISEVNAISSYSNEEVGEAKSDVKVLGAEVVASNDGDIALKSVKVSFDPTGLAGASTHLDDYIDSVSVYMGSTKIGSADVSAFTENNDNTYSKTITVSDAVIKADVTAKLYVAVDAVNNFDSSDIGVAFDVAVMNIRYTDGSGVTSTEDGFDLGSYVGIDFTSFAAAADTELKASLATDSPDAGVVMVDKTDTTEGVVLLKGKLKLDGTSDVLLDQMPVTFTSNQGVATTTGTVYLTIDGEEYSENVPASATSTIVVVFNNLDLTISAGDTVNFTVSADIEATDNEINNGDTLLASVTATNMDNLDAEDEEGDQLATGDTTGTAIGDAQAFYDEGINVSVSGTPSIVKTTGIAGNSDVAIATIKVKVEANGDTMYFAKVATSTTGFPHVFSANGANISIVSVSTTADSDVANTGYIVEEGTPEYFTFTISMETTSTTLVNAEASITSLKWGSADGVYNQTYNFNMDDYKSGSTSIKKQS